MPPSRSLPTNPSSSSSNASPRTLSKGTLGLKFMNRLKPVAPGLAASPPEAKKSEPAVVREEKQDVRMEVTKPATSSDVPRASSSGSRPQIVQSGSLLSFPLLSSTSATTFTPWSSSSVFSGRRSFGGANLEIEELENPTPKAEVKKDDKDKKTDKKRKKDDGFTAREKKPRIEPKQPPKGYLKPAGFEDLAKPSQRKQKGKAKEEEPVWINAGEEREWDAGKVEDSSDEESDAELVAQLLGRQMDEGSEDDDEVDKALELEEDSWGGIEESPKVSSGAEKKKKRKKKKQEKGGL